MSKKRYKVGYTEDLNSIVNYINTSEKRVLIKDLIQFCVDYDLYIELYMNFPIIDSLVTEHNKQIV